MSQRLLVLVLLMGTALYASTLEAHALEPGYLRILELPENTYRVFFRRPDVQGRPMPISTRFPRDCESPPNPSVRFDRLAWNATWFVRCPSGLREQTVQIDGLERSQNDVLVHFESSGQPRWTARATADQPAFQIPSRVGPLDRFGTYLGLGVEHILSGLDHLLFVVALLFLIPNRAQLVAAITAFSVAHSLTLVASVTGWIALRPRPVEAFIALSIMYVATEIRERNHHVTRFSERYPFVVSFSFGLLHGFGFAGALRDIGLPENDIPIALFSFNLGVEVGQLLFLGAFLLFVRMLHVLLRRLFDFETDKNRIAKWVALAIGGISASWFWERVFAMSQS